MTKPSILLASTSPRRRELLAQIGVSFKTVVADIDETPLPNEDPLDFVIRLAREKAKAGQAHNPDQIPVLGADTIVVVDNEVLGKPRDRKHAITMLQRLSGRTHRVLSSVCLDTDKKQRCQLSESQVHFRPMSEDEIIAYWQTGEPADKAGAYAIQGKGAIFVKRIEGSYSGVMGLPLFETANLLQQAGIQLL